MERSAANEGWRRKLIGRACLVTAVLAFLVAGPVAATDPSSPAPRRDSVSALKTRSLLHRHFKEYETKRFLILSDADPNWSRRQGEYLERAYHQFTRFSRRLGMEPEPLRHKLVCVLFESRAEYQRFANRHDGVDNVKIAGYYAPQTDRIVFYHVDSNPSVNDARMRLQEARIQVLEVSERIAEARRDGNQRLAEQLEASLQDYRTQMAREQHRIDDFAERVAIATAVHEAFHQLMFHTSLQSRDVVYPLWVSEGLAAAFETSTPNHAFGPDHEYGPRREQCNEILENGDYIPLGDFITITALQPGADHSTNIVYHQAYALVTWMFRFRRDELRTFLELMRAEPPGTPSAERHRDLFERAFGSIPTLERRWLGHERTELANYIEEGLYLDDGETITVIHDHDH